MTDSRNALYRAICASPDEDTPRLAYADLVEEEGDGERAAFIRAQIALARVPPFDPLFITTRRDNPNAIYGHAMAHALPAVPEGYDWYSFEFRRGFAWKVGVRSPGTFIADPALFDAAPIQALDINVRGRADVGALSTWRDLARIQRLEFSTSGLGADETERLGDSPYTTRLGELAFDFSAISPEGLEALARTPLFPRLTALELRSTGMPPALLADSLGAVRDRGTLQRVSLASNHLTGDDADHLFSLPVLQGVTHLDLSENARLGVAGAQALAKSGLTRGLATLDLECTHPGVPGLRMLAETGALVSLRALGLANNRLGPNSVKLLVQPGVMSRLDVLDLSDNPIGDGGASVLALTPAATKLLDLDLAGTGLTDRGAIALAESPHLSGILRLNLATATSRNQIGPLGRRALAERFGNRVVW